MRTNAMSGKANTKTRALHLPRWVKEEGRFDTATAVCGRIPEPEDLAPDRNYNRVTGRYRARSGRGVCSTCQGNLRRRKVV